MINEGTYHMKMVDNGWTARTVDGKLSAQYEHTKLLQRKVNYFNGSEKTNNHFK